MQQTEPKTHAPPGRPPNSEHTLDDTQIPASALGVVQLSNWLKPPEKFGFVIKGEFVLVNSDENGLDGVFPVFVLPNWLFINKFANPNLKFRSPNRLSAADRSPPTVNKLSII